MSDLPTPPTPTPTAPTPTPTAKPKRWPWIIGMVVSLFVGIGIGAAGAPSETKEAAGSSPVTEASTETPAVTKVPSPAEAPNVDGTWKLTACDLQLFTQGLNSSTLVGAVEVENTGNVPAIITVNLKWDALPGPLFDGGTKMVTLEPGRAREIRFTEKIGGNDVDRVQSSPGYQAASNSKFCKVTTSIDNA